MNEPAGTPMLEPMPEKKSRTWLIVVIVVVVLCGCCAALAAAAWFFGDPIVEALRGLLGS